MKSLTLYNFTLLILMCATQGIGREVDINYLTQLRVTIPPITPHTLAHSDQNYTLDEIINTSRKLDAYEWTYGSLLMRLKDPLTIQKYSKRYNESHGQDQAAYRAIADSNSPWMIPEIINVLITSQLATDFAGDDQIRLGPAGDTRVLITTILATSPEFSNEVRAWALNHRSIRNIERQNELVNIMRNWWSKNKLYFQAGTFEKVQAPTAYPAGAAPEQLTQQLAAPPPEPTPEPSKSSVAAASMPTPSPEPSSVAQKSPIWWIVGLVILAGGVLFVARRKKA